MSMSETCIQNFRLSIKSYSGDATLYRSSAPEAHPDHQKTYEFLENRNINTIIDLRTTSEKKRHGAKREEFVKRFNEYKATSDGVKPLENEIRDRKNIVYVNFFTTKVIILLGLKQLLQDPIVYVKALFQAIFSLSFSPLIAKITRDNMNNLGLLGFSKMLIEMDNGRPMKEIMMVLAAENTRYNILVHCAHGKDRTGMICGLVQEICGVPEEEILNDYYLTEGSFPEDFRLGVAKQGGYKPEFAGSPKSVMKEILRYVRQKHGSVEKYFMSIGVSKEDIERVRRRFRK